MKTPRHYHTPLLQSRRSTADGRRSAVPKQPGAELFPSKIVTIGALFTLKGGKFRHFHRSPQRRVLALVPTPRGNAPACSACLRHIVTGLIAFSLP
jgi:hypothetical protein